MSANYRSSARLGLTAIACAVLAACGTLDGATGRIAGMVTPYKIEVVQGNFVSKEQIEALQRGMTRSQVKEVLGTPLLTSVFHADRWDYVFTLKRQGVEPQSRKLALFFQGDQLDKWEGDAMPSEAEFVAQLDSTRKAAKVPLLEVPEEVLKDFNLKNPPAARAESLAAAAPPATAYPPLESPGTTTQAWDASTQRAVVAAAAARPAVQAPAPSQAPSPAPSPAPAPARAPSATPLPAQTAAAVPAAPAAVPAPGAPAVVAATPAPTAAPVAPRPVAPTPAPAPAPAPASAPVAGVSPLPAAAVAAAAVSSVTAVTPPPAAAPAPAPATAGVLVGVDPDVTSFVNGWMNDWQARNSAAYFARYAPEFKGSSATRAEWEAARRPAIENRRSVSIAVQDVRGVMIPPTGARVVFRQVYDSDAGSEIGTKALFLVKRDGRWLIEREFFTPVAR